LSNPITHDALALAEAPSTAVTAKRRAGDFVSLDLWRGVACLWVVLYHVATETIARHPAVKEFPGVGFMSLGYLGVPIFFVISGYCIASAGCNTLTRGHGFRSFAIARLRRIMPPYLASVALILLLKGMLTLLIHVNYVDPSHAPQVGLDAGGLLFYFSNLTLTQILFHQLFISRVAWTLCYEMAFYLIVALFMPLAKNARRLIALLNTLTVITLIALLASPHHTPYPFDLWPQFGLGVLVYTLLKTRSSQRWFWCASILAGAASAALLCNVPLGPLHYQPRMLFIFSTAFAVLLVLAYQLDSAISRSLPGKALIAVGRMSYSLYLIHYLVITTLLALLGSLLLKLPVAGMAILAILPVVLAYPFYLLFEKRFVSPGRTTLRAETRPTAW
jgi:exopolysaccharide production protein ExoZ